MLFSSIADIRLPLPAGAKEKPTYAEKNENSNYLVYRLPHKKRPADKSDSDYGYAKPDKRLSFRRENSKLLEKFYSKPIVLSGLADLAMTQGQTQRAGLLLGAANSIYDEFGFWNSLDRTVHDRATAAVRANMNDEAFASALEEGLAMTLEEAITHALACH